MIREDYHLLLECYNFCYRSKPDFIMASIIQIGDKWRAQVRRKGHKTITKTHATKKAAEAWARRVEADIESGGAVVETRQDVAALIEKYRELRENSGRPVRDDSNTHYMLKHLEDGLGEVLASSLDTDKILSWCQLRKKEGAGPYTINMEISTLGTVLRHVGSVLRLRLPDIVGEARPSLRHFGLIGGGGKRDRRPTADELSRLFEYFAGKPEIGPPMEDIIRLAITIGLRRGEIFRLEWRDVDAEQKMLTVRDRKDPRNKIGNTQSIPLIGESFEIIARQPRRDGDPRIFPWGGSVVSKYFTNACKALEIPDLHFHDCRHEAASALIEAGWSTAEVRMITGHKSSSMLDRYVNLDPADLHAKVVPISKARKIG